MADPTRPTFADDCAAVLGIMADGGPQALDDITTALNCSHRHANDLLCALRDKGQIAHLIVRERGRKINKYALKGTQLP
jgi:hypothetical protein